MFDQMTSKEVITLFAYFAVAFIGMIAVPYAVWRLDHEDTAEEAEDDEADAAPH